MKSYGQFCPVAIALEVLAERWTLLVVRELLSGSRRFNQLARGVPLMSRTMLSQRLKTLEDAGIVVKTPASEGSGHQYALTQAGRELEPIVDGLGRWGQRWATTHIDDEHLDVSLLMWDMRRRIDHRAVPSGRVVVRFELSGPGARRQHYWLRLEFGEADLCLKDPGFDVQLVVETDVRTLTEVWMGKRSLARAVKEKAISLTGKPAFRRDFPRWLQLSVFAAA